MHHHPELRERIGSAKTFDALEAAVEEMKTLCLAAAVAHEENPSEDNFKAVYNALPHPYWICQPYVRPPPSQPNAHNGYGFKFWISNLIFKMSDPKWLAT